MPQPLRVTLLTGYLYSPSHNSETLRSSKEKVGMIKTTFVSGEHVIVRLTEQSSEPGFVPVGPKSLKFCGLQTNSAH